MPAMCLHLAPRGPYGRGVYSTRLRTVDSDINPFPTMNSVEGQRCLPGMYMCSK